MHASGNVLIPISGLLWKRHSDFARLTPKAWFRFQAYSESLIPILIPVRIETFCRFCKSLIPIPVKSGIIPESESCITDIGVTYQDTTQNEVCWFCVADPVSLHLTQLTHKLLDSYLLLYSEPEVILVIIGALLKYVCTEKSLYHHMG